MNLADFCIKRPVTTVMFFSALIILGVVSYSKMRMDLYPEVTYPTLNVSVSYPGAGPEEIEQMVTIPVEQAVATINGVKEITSVSSEGSVRVTAEFDWGRDLADATNDLRASLDRVARRLPEDASTPTVSKYDPSSQPIMSLGVSGSMDEFSLRRFAEEELTNILQRADGVASVDVMGGKKREISILLYQDRLQAFGISGDQVASALKNENAMLPAGHLTSGTGDFLLRAQGEFQSLDEMRDLVVATRNGAPIYLRTLAEVDEGFEDEQSIVRIDGRPGIVVSIRKRSDANTVATADQIYKVLEEAKQRYPQVKLRILNDGSTYIRNAVKSVTDSAWQGGILAALVLLFFLANLRMTVFASVVMPISILTTLILAYFSKMTLNTISLGGLALGVGMLVDNTVVVLDNIFRHHHQGSGVIQAAREGTREMGPALMASTLTTICVFFPLIFLTGRDGIIYKELSYMVIYSLLCSLFVAVTLIPTLCTKFLKERDLDEDGLQKSDAKGLMFALQHRWEDIYEKALRWSLQRKGIVIGGCFLIFLVSLSFYPLIGTELVQSSDEGIISVSLQLPSGTQLAETTAQTEQVQNQIRRLVPEIENEEMTAGGRWGQGGQTNRAYLTLRLKPKSERKRSTADIVEVLQSRINIPGARVRIDAQNSMRMFHGGSNNPIAVDVRGYDQVAAKQIAYQVMDKIGKIPGITNVNVSRDEDRPELSIRVNRKRAADLGVTASQIANALQNNIEGKLATVYRKDGREYQVRVNLREADRATWQDLGNIVVPGRNGTMIPLSSLVTFAQSEGKVNIERKNQQRNLSVEAGITGRDLGSIVRDVNKALLEVPVPEGITLHLGGDYEEQQKSNKEMTLVLILSLILVYMVMASQFESYLDPFLIMFSIPFGLSGVILILFLTDTAFNSQVYLGIIMLGGIVVNNAIVLVSYFRILMEKGLSLEEAVVKGGRSRLRPILMTTVTTILGLLPLAIGLGEGAETQTPLARTVIGGLTFSTVLTLFIIPIMFAGVESMRRRMREKRDGARSVSVVVMIILFVVAAFSVPAVKAAADEPVVRSLTVEQAVELSLTNNPAAKTMAYRREYADSVYRQTMSSAKVNVFSDLDLQSPESGKDRGNNLSVTAKQEKYLDNLRGAKSLHDQIAEDNLRITLFDIDQDQQDLIYRTVATFQEAVQARNDLSLAKENYEKARSLQDEVLARSKAGLTDITDELGAEAQVSAALTQVKRGEKTERVAIIRLKRMVGLDESIQLQLVQPVAEPMDPALNGLTELALANRLDLKIGEESMKQSQTLLSLARLSKNIGISLDWTLVRKYAEGGIGLTNQSSNGSTDEWQTSWRASLATGAATEDDSDWGTIRLGFHFNIFDGGKVKEGIRQAELLVDERTMERQRLREDALLEVEAAYYDYLEQQDLLENAEVQYNYHRVYLEATQAKMRSGLATVKDVLEAQTMLNQSALAREKIQNDLYLARIMLLKVTGRLGADLKGL